MLCLPKFHILIITSRNYNSKLHYWSDNFIFFSFLSLYLLALLLTSFNIDLCTSRRGNNLQSLTAKWYREWERWRRRKKEVFALMHQLSMIAHMKDCFWFDYICGWCHAFGWWLLGFLRKIGISMAKFSCFCITRIDYYWVKLKS